MVLLEAAASGLPQVATDAGGIPEAVVHERTGYVVPSGDSGALAAAMQRMSALSREDLAAMGCAAREHVTAHFELSAVTSRWEELYRELTDAARWAAMEV